MQIYDKHPINNLPIDIFNIIASTDYMVYRALLGVYTFGMSTVNNSEKYRTSFGIKLQFNTKWNRRTWEQRMPGKCNKVITDLSQSKHYINGVLYRVSRHDGSFCYCDSKRLGHREDGPAVKTVNGKEIIFEWKIHGQLHRIDGPAVETNTGRKEWFQNGKRFRKEGPAVEKEDGTKIWYQDSWTLFNYVVPKEIIYSDGTKEFYSVYGKKYRAEYPDGTIQKWHEGRPYI